MTPKTTTYQKLLSVGFGCIFSQPRKENTCHGSSALFNFSQKKKNKKGKRKNDASSSGFRNEMTRQGSPRDDLRPPKTEEPPFEKKAREREPKERTF